MPGTQHRKTRKKKSARRQKTNLAKSGDKYDLYQKSVQDPDHEVKFFERVYRQAFKSKPRVLREDFCGTFAVCCQWVTKKDRVAVGVDIDAEPLNWGQENNLAQLKEEQQNLVTLHQADVCEVNDAIPKADVLGAQNFSFFCFKTRQQLREYFQAAYENLNEEGVMVLDMMGGPECLEEDHEDVRDCDGFKYVWEQSSFDPITHDAKFYIHFRFKDGSELKRIFKYDWRFWSIPEVRELLEEAGFDQTHVYWEGADSDGEGNGKWNKRKSASSDPSWIAYIVAVKQ